MTDYTLLIAGAVVLVALALGLWLLMGRKGRRKANLRERFGPEYDRAVAETGSPERADELLAEREKRVKSYRIHPLKSDERKRFADSWHRVQAKFVDDPAIAVGEADLLVTELMSARGYPMADFDTRVEDLSVDHPTVVHHYREAREIARRQSVDAASTEELRQALVHYKALFADLLDDGSKKGEKRIA